MDADDQKQRVAAAALSYVEPGMKLGLGTGSTARVFVEKLGQEVAKGLKILGVPTSEATRQQAQALGIGLTSLEDEPELDLVVDGADEFDADLRLIKGGGGALLREKIVAASAKRMLVIADASKRVSRLGAFPLPVEVVPFGFASTRLRLERALAALGLTGTISPRRRDEKLFVTDGGHYILDCAFGTLLDPERLAARLHEVPGVVEHGLFLGLATIVLVAGPSTVEKLERR